MAIRIHGASGSWVLPRGASVLGRSTTCDVRIDEPRLSRRHARFVVDGHDLVVEDLGSRNGVVVDGVRINGTQAVRHGQVVVCGPVVLMVSIDPTQPHPRMPEGRQASGPRRAAVAEDTEAMLDAVPAGASASHPSRSIDPAIFAAIASPPVQVPAPEAARQSALQPAPMPGSLTSPLESIRPAPRPAPPQRRAPTTTNIEMLALPPSSTGALLAPIDGRIAPQRRLWAGVVDGAWLAVPFVLATSCGFTALAVALTLAGAAVSAGLPVLGPTPAAGLMELVVAMLHPVGFAAGLSVAMVAAVQPAVLAVVAAGAALAALVLVGGSILAVVMPSVESGASRGLRAVGLQLCRLDGTTPGFLRATVRWALAALLWPLALPAVALRWRAPHDVLTGCMLAERD